jgi:hypothetical protein
MLILNSCEAKCKTGSFRVPAICALTGVICFSVTVVFFFFACDLLRMDLRDCYVPFLNVARGIFAPNFCDVCIFAF